jgi:hypothetical protein
MDPRRKKMSKIWEKKASRMSMERKTKMME